MVKIESIRVLGIDSDDLTHDLLTVKQSAAYYGCSIENIHKMIQAGKLDCFIDQEYLFSIFSPTIPIYCAARLNIYSLLLHDLIQSF